MASAISAIGSLIASTTGSSGGANQASALQKQLQALQQQLSTVDCETCSDTRQANEQQINRQIQKVQTQLAQVQPADKSNSADKIDLNRSQSAAGQNGAGGSSNAGSAPVFSFSHLGSLIDTTA
ncbi:MAG TPA: FlxA-like family protein [Herbaspirillum sp.]|jgi:hypothetical protein